MAILHIFQKLQRNSDPLEDTIKNIKAGDTLLREKMIDDYKPFIIKVVSKVTGRYVDLENSEEFSIGLIAFNEAIDCYDRSKNAGFISFCETVIKRRVIDYYRKNSKNNKVYPITYFYNDDKDKNSKAFEEKYLIIDSDPQFENIEKKEEISLFIKRLEEFGITLEELVKIAPKHLDSKQISIRIARIILDNRELSDKLERKKTIPMVELMKLVDINRKTIERNRKFIISVYLILSGNLEIMQGYVKNIEKGGRQ